MSARAIVVGTRGSRLALAQAELVVRALEAAGRSTRISIIETAGDRRAPDTAWGEGAFVAAIERALLAGDVDLAVHSAKDIPTDEDPRLCIGAYLPRADARDALVVRSEAPWRRLDDLPPGTRVGTDSPRRTGFVHARRPDLVVQPLHGNVDTRLRRLDAGETDALVLACAGLDRLGQGDRIAERIDPAIVPPAPGQGAVAVQVRGDDADALAAVSAIDDRGTRLAVEAERAFLAACGGGCRSPIGALASVSGIELKLLGGLAAVDGSKVAVKHDRGPLGDGDGLARRLAAAIAHGPNPPTGETGSPRPAGPLARRAAPRVIVTRAAQQAGELIAALAARGLEPISIPAIAVEPVAAAVQGEAGRLDGVDWVVVTSANGARSVAHGAGLDPATPGSARWAAVGRATASLLEQDGRRVSFMPSRSDARTLAEELPVQPGDHVVVLRGDLADGELVTTLSARGAIVQDRIVYRTQEGPVSSRALLGRALAAGPVDAIVFTSGSTVRGLIALARAEALAITAIPAICIGPETALEARAAGFEVVAISTEPDAGALADTTARAVLDQPLEIR
jgi:hydroxymethylbilane synthase